MLTARLAQLPLFPAAKARRKTAAHRGAKRGPKARVERAGFVAHRTRPEHSERHPVHVSMKRVRLAPSLRSERVYAAIVEQIRAAVARGVGVVQFSVQHDHIHVVAEAADKKALAGGMQRLFSRIAFAVNRVAERSGSLFRDRHHRRPLKTPTEVRRALVYVLFNTRKHAPQSGPVSTDDVDPCSSLIWFKAWHPNAAPSAAAIEQRRSRAGPCPLAPARTWLAATGWKRAGGAIRFDESPAA